METESDFCPKNDSSPLAPPRRKSIHKDKKEKKNASVKKSRSVSLVTAVVNPENESTAKSDSNAVIQTKTNSLKDSHSKTHSVSEEQKPSVKPPKKPPPPSKAAINFYSNLNSSAKKTATESSPVPKPKPAPRPKFQKPTPAPRSKVGHEDGIVKSEKLVSDNHSLKSGSLPPDSHDLSELSTCEDDRKSLSHDSDLSHHEASLKPESESSNSDTHRSISHGSNIPQHVITSSLQSFQRSVSVDNYLVNTNDGVSPKLKRAQSFDFAPCDPDSTERNSDDYENVVIQKSPDQGPKSYKRVKQQNRNSSQSYENVVNRDPTQLSGDIFFNESMYDPSRETAMMMTNHLTKNSNVLENKSEHLNNNNVFDDVTPESSDLYDTPKSIEVSTNSNETKQGNDIYYNVVLSPTEGFYSTPKLERRSIDETRANRSNSVDSEYLIPSASASAVEKKTRKTASCYEEVDIETSTQPQTKQTEGWYSSPPPPRPPPPRRNTAKSSSLQKEEVSNTSSSLRKEEVSNTSSSLRKEEVSNTSSSLWKEEVSNTSSLLQKEEDISIYEEVTDRDSQLKAEDSEFSDSESEEEDQEFVKPKDKLYSIANEILSTERSLVYALSLICEEFAASLNAAIAKNSKLLPEGAYGSIFMNIEQIYELDKKFLQELDERMEIWETEKRIGDIVKRFVYFTKMYTTYIKGYDNAMAVYHECYATNMKFSQIVNQFENSEKSKNLKLTSYLIKPIQRIPSFRLLLIEYLSNLPSESVEYQDISDSVNTVSEVANDINESMKEGEKFQEVLRIQSQIVNAGDIVKPGRFLLKEGFIHKLSRKELQQRFFILFTDALLYCSSVGHNHLRLIMELPLARMIVQQPDSHDMTNEFIIITTRRSFLLNASSPKERDDWVSCLQSAIDVVNHKIGSFVLNQQQSEGSSELYTDIGGVAPPWIPDSRVTMCQICTEVFTVYKRRHHCRGCGKVVCSNCSAYEAPLQYMDYEAARVCETCFTHLSKKFQQLEESGKCDHELLSSLRMKFKNSKFKRKKTKRLLPSTLTEIGAQEEGIETSGFLRLKKGKKEKRCWFVLKDHVLYTYKAPSDPAATSTIPVLGYEVDVSGNWDEDDFMFQLTHPGVKEALIFKADNRTTAERWVYCLCKATSLQQIS